MGLKDAFVNIAASAITSRVNSAVGGVLDAAFGSKGRASASGPAAALDNKTRFTTDNLAYPINVEGDPMQGHYILFSAREQDPAKLKTKVKGESPAALGKKINAQNGIGQTLKNGKAAIKNSPIKNLNVAALKNAKGNPKTTSANAITTSRIASSRVTTTIALYMPPSVAVSYDSKYADAEIGNLAQFGMEAFNTLSAGGDFSDMGKKLGSSVKERGGAALKKGAVKAADAAAPGAAALIALERGKIVTPKMELMFEGIGRRSFSFSFVFIPKSEAEAIVVDKIIAKFKFHMTPVFMDGAREMKIPDVFDIEYMYQDRQNNFLNKISTCYLQKADVSYGGDRFTAYEPASTYKPGSPPPQRTTLALTFGEIELIDRDKVTEGY
jgi:hypothetical protein